MEMEGHFLDSLENISQIACIYIRKNGDFVCIDNNIEKGLHELNNCVEKLIKICTMYSVIIKEVVRCSSGGVSDSAVADVALGVEADVTDRRPVSDLA